MRGEAELAGAWADACNQNIETVRFHVRLRRDCLCQIRAPLASIHSILLTMATSDAAAVGSSPYLVLGSWDAVYQKGFDNWTKEGADLELLKFRSTLMNGKTDLDILVPMSGKSIVLLSLAEEGHRVVGIEWSKVAVEQFFEENNLKYCTELCNIGGTSMPKYKAEGKAVTIYCGDFFSFKQHKLAPFDCVLDHGALECFDFRKETTPRAVYAEIIKSFMKPGGRMLLSIFDYEHAEHPGLPYAVTEAEVNTLYKEHFKIQLLQESDSKKMVDTFEFTKESLFGSFPTNLSRFSWKILLLVKQS